MPIRYICLHTDAVWPMQRSECILEDCMEVFMDDFIVYAESFDACLENLSWVLRRCMENNLVLNFEKCHCMVTRGLFWDILYPAFHKELQKDCLALIQATSKRCGLHFLLALCGSFPGVEEAPNWEYPFELMCDTSNSTLGAVLGQRVGKQLHVIVYMSQTMDSAQLRVKTGVQIKSSQLRPKLSQPDEFLSKSTLILSPHDQLCSTYRPRLRMTDPFPVVKSNPCVDSDSYELTPNVKSPHPSRSLLASRLTLLQ
ncbi:hypothetical protein CR513_39541, partial [Mucuna pruriens]